ncbi:MULTISPECIES: hypothetical protein [unclassified Phormidium]|uniref:hypothetical protein n=1 Tax=Cyanophyceae TaxID=3028117 RepID=UPI001685D80F|nr:MULTISPECIES: hypothetical protein [unclassified Phormidium]MBD1918887.1 hypothetical protein [Phormidium sp. FACHB-77]MBD2033271.1 hypothetical protein [Phormidium sp. FACHB-322]MBD2053796.1 hypothetical protein [Leptolyngbya sp. FACHB-60]
MKPIFLALLALAAAGCDAAIFHGIDSIGSGPSNGCQKMSAYGDIWEDKADNNSPNSLWFQENCRSWTHQRLLKGQ